MTITLPAHYGSTGQPWPKGRYWLIEHRRAGEEPLYWTDTFDQQGRTGWTLVPQYAAGFSSRAEAMTAFHERGDLYLLGDQVSAFEHEWVEV
jgi:hypothetical protein